MKNLGSKPFALIGINTNGYKPEQLKKVMDKEKLNWRSFADYGDKGPRPISTQWNLVGTPTLYVLDHQGIIRHKWVGGPGEKVIDEALNALIKKAEADATNASK